MGIVSSLIASPTSLSLPPAVLAPAIPDLVSTRLTSEAVPAPLSTLQTNSDTSGKTPVPASITAQAIRNESSSASTGSAESNGPSTLFLTQLLGQSDNLGTVALATSFAQFSPAPTYDTLVGYSFIKYKPSFAGLPEPDLVQNNAAQQNVSTAASPAAVSAANEFQAYNDTQSRNQQNLTVSEPQIAIAG